MAIDYNLEKQKSIILFISNLIFNPSKKHCKHKGYINFLSSILEIS